MNSIVFKQWYKPANAPSSAVLNQKHLEYIATRKGTMCNEGCGFGLWGKLPWMFSPRNLDNLKIAKKVVGEASRPNKKRHARTLYRAVFSADEEMAQEYGLHDRLNWESLVNAKIGVLAKEMNIEPKNFCWVASMHYKRSQPHVHIMYWDNGTSPRIEFVPQNRFECMTDKVRAEFNRELARDEIKELQANQKGFFDSMRSELGIMLDEFDTTAMLDIDRITIAQFNELGKGLCHLITHPPSGGSFRYAYLKDPYKQLLDDWLDQLMKLPQFAKMEQNYASITNDISKLYGNGATKTEWNLKKSASALRKALGNEVLNLVKELVATDDINEADTIKISLAAKAKVQQLLKADPLYKELLGAMPSRRTPWKEIEKDSEFMDIKKKLVNHLASDIRVRRCLKLSKNELKEVYATIYQMVGANAVEDKQYNIQKGAAMAMRALIRLFSTGGRQVAPAARQRAQLKISYKNLSKEAKKDLQKKRSQAGNWESEL